MASNDVLRELFRLDRSTLEIDDSSDASGDSTEPIQRQQSSERKLTENRANKQPDRDVYFGPPSTSGSQTSRASSTSSIYESYVQGINVRRHRKKNIMKGSFTVRSCGGQNVEPYLQHGENHRKFTEHVFLDTGTPDNWISFDVVKARGLRYDRLDHPKYPIIDFNGEIIECCGSISVFWYTEKYGKMVPTTLYISKNAPFYVLFGLNFLLQQEIVKIERVFENTNFAFPGVRGKGKGKAKEDPERAENSQKLKEQKKQEEFKKWHKKMKDQGWTWDVLSKGFYKIEVDKRTGEQRRVHPPQSSTEWRATVNNK